MLLLSFACFEAPDTDTTDSDADTDADTDSDTDSDTDTDSDIDIPEVGGRNWTGEAHVVVGASWIGFEIRTLLDTAGDVLCVERYDLAGTPAADCPECTFAFATQTSNVTTLDGDWCAEFGLGTDVWSEELAPGLGFDATTSFMAYKDSRYDWSVVSGTITTWSGDSAEGDLTWDWNWMLRDFYGYE